MSGGRRDDGPYVIAEIGVNHNGDLDLARRSIDAASHAGVDAVKFQTFDAGEFMADRELVYEYENDGRRVRESMYAMFKRLELPPPWHAILRDHAAERGVDFLSSAADTQAVDLLVDLGVPALKLASEDLINLPLLRHVGRCGVPVILSTGMATEQEIDDAVELLRASGCPELTLLHCVSIYPTPDEQANLRRMVSLRERYECRIGYSDHTRGMTAAVAATTLGAEVIEKHFTIDRTLPGPDHAFSADPSEMANLVREVRRVTRQLGDAELTPAAGERESRRQFRRSVVAKETIPVGVPITTSMLCLKRPGGGIPPREMDRLLGRRVLQPVGPDEPMRWELVE